MIVWNRTLLGLLVTLLMGCQTRLVMPLAIAPEDVCSYCKMSISEKRYAAQCIDRDGEAFKFDDLTCMIASNKESNIVGRFVMDFAAKQWVRAEDAIYVQSDEINAPMGGGTIAFRDESNAQLAAATYHGKLLRFDEVFSRKTNSLGESESFKGR